MDQPLSSASALIERARTGERSKPIVRSFFDEPTFTASYVVHDPITLKAAIIDSVLGFDPASGRTSVSVASRALAA